MCVYIYIERYTRKCVRLYICIGFSDQSLSLCFRDLGLGLGFCEFLELLISFCLTNSHIPALQQ